MGINDIPMPCTPERVWRAIQSARDTGAGQNGGGQ
jgi:aerobic carbon-monoxide dehydrogenase large subunit